MYPIMHDARQDRTITELYRGRDDKHSAIHVAITNGNCSVLFLLPFDNAEVTFKRVSIWLRNQAF